MGSPLRVTTTREGKLPLAGGPLPYRLQRRKGARRITLRLDESGEARVTLPWQCPFDEALWFLRKNEAWLTERLAARTATPSLAEWLKHEGSLSLDGQSFAAKLQPTIGKPYALVDTPRSTVLLAHGERVEASLVELVRNLAAETLPRRVAELAAAHGHQVTRTTVRDQRRRWGSCSSAGSLSLNWRLILLPPPLCDHIILHELAHLREPNHSPRFWAYLHQLDPGTDTARREIRARESTLLVLGRLDTDSA